MKKLLVTMDIGGYAPELTKYTIHLMKEYCTLTDTDFVCITERKFPDFPITYEKFQISTLGKDYDYVMWLDADCIISLDTPSIPDMLYRNALAYFPTGHNLFDGFFREELAGTISVCNYASITKKDGMAVWTPFPGTWEELQEEIIKYIDPLHALEQLPKYEQTDEDTAYFKSTESMSPNILKAIHRRVDELILTHNYASFKVPVDTVRYLEALDGYIIHLNYGVPEATRRLSRYSNALGLPPVKDFLEKLGKD